jgi:UDP-N-acetylmuramoyl-tripeptide--D-alanyl-D-alanine ligase
VSVATGERLAAGAAFTLEEVLRATAGELVRLGGAVRFPGVCTDTRTLRPGELFVAIRGDAHDGHAFVGAAAAAGAGAVVVDRAAADVDAGCGVVAVRDTLAALGDLAALHRRRRPATVLAVCGSNGKTTTKEMLATILRAAFGDAAVLQTRGTQNNLVGLPLTLLRLEDERVAVVELGMNGFGEVWRLAEIAQPDVGVVTCIGPEHLEGVGSIRGAAEAEAELYRRLRPSAIAVVNADDAWVVRAAAGFPGRTLRFGDGGDVRATDVVDAGLDGTRFTLHVGDASAPVVLPVPGRHNVGNALAAAAMAHAVGGGPDVAARALASFAPPSMRMQVVRLPSGVTVVNDAYNANPQSMSAALRTVAASAATRRLAALGEMRELGDHAAEAHEALGRELAATGFDLVWVLGPYAARVAAGARAAGLPDDRVVVAADHDDLGARVAAACRPGDLLLIKGSRGAAMEGVLRRLGGA